MTIKVFQTVRLIGLNILKERYDIQKIIFKEIKPNIEGLYERDLFDVKIVKIDDKFYPVALGISETEGVFLYHIYIKGMTDSQYQELIADGWKESA